MKMFLDRAKNYLECEDGTLKLRPKEVAIIAALAVAGRPLKAAELARAVWPDKPPGRPDLAIRVYICRIRDMVADIGWPEVIPIGRCDGYRLADDVVVRDPPPPVRPPPAPAPTSPTEVILDMNFLRLRRGDDIVALQPLECRLLDLLAGAPVNVTSELLIARIWPERDVAAPDGRLRGLVASVDQRLRQSGWRPMIRHYHSVGYGLWEPVETIRRAEAT